MLTRAGNQVALFIVHARIQNAAVFRKLAQYRAIRLSSGVSVRIDGATLSVTVRQRPGQLLKLRVTLSLVILAKPDAPCISATNSARQIRTITAR